MPHPIIRIFSIDKVYIDEGLFQLAVHGLKLLAGGQSGRKVGSILSAPED
jgi:hypothetical protein